MNDNSPCDFKMLVFKLNKNVGKTFIDPLLQFWPKLNKMLDKKAGLTPWDFSIRIQNG